MQIAARYNDGQVSQVRGVLCTMEGAGPIAVLTIADRLTGEVIERWPAADIYPLPARRHELRLAANGKPPGARLVVSGFEATRDAKSMLPGLDEHRRRERGGQLRLIGLATLALGSVILAYVFGVPLLASRIVGLVPAQWEAQMGDMVAEQLREALTSEGNGFEVCDPDPDSLANRAIARFASAAMEGANSPFTPSITVIKTDIPNAFALPGGRAYYFSALLEKTESPDEFAGVMAHELGHVAHRHGMEQLISTAGTGLLIGFILGDMTGVSVAGAVGTALVDSRFSREAERQADAFALAAAERMNFEPVGLADLLDRVSEDDAFSRALALLSTHPLTAERRAALDVLHIDDSTDKRAPFSVAEWQAIKAMCGATTAGKSGDKNTSRP